MRKKRKSSRKLKLRPGIRGSGRVEAPKKPAGGASKELGRQKDLLHRNRGVNMKTSEADGKKEKRAIYADATAEAVKAILPIADSLEYAVKAEDGAGGISKGWS